MKVVHCPCGVDVSGETDDALVENVEAHISADHPDLVGQVLAGADSGDGPRALTTYAPPPRRARAPGLLMAVVVFAVASGCGSTTTVTETMTRTVTDAGTEPTGLGPPGERVEFGHIGSLTRTGDHYEMRFDPALILSGETANTAAAEDGVVAPGEPVPNDNYVVDESPRTYTYLVADDVKVTLLVRGSPEKWGPTPVMLAELVRIIDGTSDLELFEPLDTGVWITIDVDTVRSVYQQYRP